MQRPALVCAAVLTAGWTAEWTAGLRVQVAACHAEARFDGWFFQGTFKDMLGQYTYVTGPPFMVPIYGLGLGDSDCYHNARHNNSTKVVLAVADSYKENNMYDNSTHTHTHTHTHIHTYTHTHI